MALKRRFYRLKSADNCLRCLDNLLKEGCLDSMGYNDLYMVLDQASNDLISEVLEVADYIEYFGKERSEDGGFYVDEAYEVFRGAETYKDFKKGLKTLMNEFQAYCLVDSSYGG